MRPRLSRGALLTSTWAAAGALALLAAAWWLRAPALRYVVAAAAATAISALLLLPQRRVRRWAAAAAAAMGASCIVAGIAQKELRRIERDWPAYRQERIARGQAMLRARLDSTDASLRQATGTALEVPPDTAAALRALDRLAGRRTDRAILLTREGRPLAWGGHAPVRMDTLTAPNGVVLSPFYVVRYATEARGADRAIAAALVHAAPPADRIARGLDVAIAQRAGLRGFEFLAPEDSAAEGAAAHRDGRGEAVLWLRAVAPSQGEASLGALERARAGGAVVLAVALILFITAAWQQFRSLGGRMLTLAIAAVCVGLVPLNTFSARSSLFDPAVYFAGLGGPFTANVAALTLSSAILLVALLSVLRQRARVPSRALAAVLVVIFMGLGPFLLRDLARGVTAPPGGVTIGLWLAWQVALFLAATALLLGAAAAGRAALRGRGGLPPILGPGLAALAALIGPIVLDAPGRYPGWYPFLWIAAIGALALARSHRPLIVSAALVAALGATILTWRAGVRERVDLATRDVDDLSRGNEFAVALLERFAASLPPDEPPRSAAELLRQYVGSDLAAANYPVELSSWRPDGLPAAELSLSPVPVSPDEIARAVDDARTTRRRIVRAVFGDPGTQLVLAVPHSSGDVTVAAVQPRSRLIPDDPYNSLVGIPPRDVGEAPYGLSVAPVDPRGEPGPGEPRWYRTENELHGDRVLATSQGPVRAHIEVDLRSPDLLIQRGTLVVLFDLLIVLGLWIVSVAPGGGLQRWLRVRLRGWSRSYRARLTLALFAFFVMPALVFALWSYRRLQAEDRQSRALLVRETLRSVEAAADSEQLAAVGDRLRTPLFVYRDGALRATSDPLYDQLAPLGRFLPDDVFVSLALGGEVDASRQVRIGGVPTLVGYRLATGPGRVREIIAAPSRGSEDVLDRRRRDLGVLVLFATVLGAAGALWLSGVAARSLAEPIGRLRQAALAIAGGEREPLLQGMPPEEFGPVFSAFRRMASDLGESRAALEQAQQRTSAVLRNVASGVVALDRAGDVTIANPRAELLLGRSLATGTRLQDIVAAPLVRRVRAFLADDGDEEEFDMALGARQLHVRLTRLRRAGGGAVVTLDDVTELARAQRVLAWGEMARQVAHEIKNPLTPIRLGVQHLRRARADARDDFDIILDRNVARILTEIDRLDEIARSFSRYGTAPAERLPATLVDVAAVVRDVVELERLGRDDVEWHVHGASAPERAMARAEELREVLLNVLENARDAGARRVEARLGSNGDQVVVEVADDGHGIPATVLPRIFEPHFSTRTSGSGLGLAISRQLVEGWGGEIDIESTQGRGTLVRVRLRRGATAARTSTR